MRVTGGVPGWGCRLALFPKRVGYRPVPFLHEQRAGLADPFPATTIPSSPRTLQGPTHPRSGFDTWLPSLADGPAGAAEAAPEGMVVPRFRFSRPLLHHMRLQRRFFQAIMVRGGDAAVRRRVTALLVELVRRELARMSRSEAGTGVEAGDAELCVEAHAHGAVGAFLGLVAWWLERGGRFDVEAVDRVFQRLAALPL